LIEREDNFSFSTKIKSNSVNLKTDRNKRSNSYLVETPNSKKNIENENCDNTYFLNKIKEPEMNKDSEIKEKEKEKPNKCFSLFCLK